MKEQIYTFLQRSRTSKYANVYFALLFAFSLFVQCVLFHWFAFHSIMVSSFWKAPAYFWAFYLPKISISLFISSLVFLFKRKYWVIYVSVLTNVWILIGVFPFNTNFYWCIFIFITQKSTWVWEQYWDIFGLQFATTLDTNACCDCSSYIFRQSEKTYSFIWCWI